MTDESRDELITERIAICKAEGVSDADIQAILEKYYLVDTAILFG